MTDARLGLWRAAAAARTVGTFLTDAARIVATARPGVALLGFARLMDAKGRLELVGTLPASEAFESAVRAALDADRSAAEAALARALDVAPSHVHLSPFEGQGFRGAGLFVAPPEATEAIAILDDVLRVAGPRLFEEGDSARRRETLEAEREVLVSKLQKQQIVEEIVGEGRGLREVMRRVDSVAATDAPVLILGETGSGKEMVARAVHERSAFAGGPIVRVNCGAIPPELVDSELFGHEKGSFTGAVGTRKGWFERADGGTLFLDEVGELPLAAQVRLLRVLQDGTLERVGGTKPIHVRVRIVAATHRDLPRMVEEGTFRRDLWYRLCVFPVHLPPLRERLEDIPDLARHFAARIGERLGGGPLAVTESDLALLASYPWPGNVRELASVIERAAILGHGARLELRASLGAVEAPRNVDAPARTSAGSTPPPAPSQPRTSDRGALADLDGAVIAHIESALRTTRGRIEGPFGAAELLRVNPHTLRARMRKLGIDWSRFRARA
jgi:transcriptional regulator with GAF, ATPase, and Fis domain